MPRFARKKSGTGVYHVILRGINQRDIFYDDEDKVKFIETLDKYKDISEYSILGYCLMSNHIHLLLKEGNESISKLMKRIGVSYVYWYNNKYERCGHLFQDRYRSEIVEEYRYLITVLRYIHQNPVKAGIVKDIGEYQWSSYDEYISTRRSITDVEYIISMLNEDKAKGLEIFKKFMNQDNTDQCLEYKNTTEKKVTDVEAIEITKNILNSENIEILYKLNKEERDEAIRELKKKISIRQLSRITGLGKRIIEKA